MILKHIRRRLKVFSVLSSLAILIPTRTNLHACGWGSETEELRYMLFNPDLLEDRSWWTFFYNNKFHYLDGTMFSQDDETILAREWIKEMKISVDESEAVEWLFSGLPDSLQTNSFYKKIQSNDALKKYFDLAKRCEVYSSSSSPWESDEEKAGRRSADPNLLADLDAALSAESNPLLKKKYAFQVLRASFYAPNETLFLNTYSKYFKGVSKTNRTVLDWWALHYRSMYTEGDSANYLHAIIFNNSSAKRYVSRLHFSTENLDGVLALAQDDEERADIYVLASSINPGRGLDHLKKIYGLAPNHRQLPLIVGREINKLEDWLGSLKFGNPMTGSGYYDEPSMENWQRDYEYLQEVIDAIGQMHALAQKYPDFYNLAMANLYLMKGNEGGTVTQYLDKVRSANPDLVYQKKALKLIAITQQSDVADGKVQDEIGELFLYLVDNREMKFESQKILYSISSYLRYVFAHKGMIHIAGLLDNFASNKFCYSCSFDSFEYSMIGYFDRYASINDIARVIELYDRPIRNKLEEILLKPYADKNYLYDILAVKYLREGNVKSSLSVLRKIPDSFWFSFVNASENLNNDPFLNNSELFGVQTMVSYNRREILERMVTLETEAINNFDKKAENYFQLGNAWYNFTANSWFMLSYGYGSMASEKAFTIGRVKALEYYKKALVVEREAERRAKITYMIALLSDDRDKVAAATRYEEFKDTEFYNRRNCLTTQDLVSGNM